MTTREVFLHELAHLVRHDHLWNFLGRIGTVLIPLQPLVWILTSMIEETSDYVCDDYVVHLIKSDKKYASQLYNMVHSYHLHKQQATAGIGIFSVKSTLLKRIERILDESLIRRLNVRSRNVASVAFLFFCSIIITGFIGFKKEIMHIKSNIIEYAAVFTPAVPTDEKDTDNRPLETGRDTVEHESPPLAVSRKSFSAGWETDDYGMPLSGTANDMTDMNSRPIRHDNPETKHRHTGDLNADSEFMKHQPEIDLNPPLTRGSDEIGHMLSSIIEPGIPVADNPLKAVVVTGLQASPLTNLSNAATPVASLKVLEIKIPTEFNSGGTDESGHLELEEFYQTLRKNQQSPVWSPDSKRIAFNDSDYGVWIVSAEGGEPQLIYDNYYKILYKNFKLHYGEIQTVGFSPDGTELAFRRYGLDDEGRTKVVFNDQGEVRSYTIENPVPVIESVNISTGKSRILTENGLTGSWSHNGRYFAYITETDESERELYIKDLTSGFRWQIECVNPEAVYFTPDDSGVIVSENERDGVSRIIQITLYNREQQELMGEQNIIVSDMSPDGRWLFCADSTDDPRQFLFNMHSGDFLNITAPGMTGSGWGKFSPDGSKICLNLIEGDGDDMVSNIYIQDLQKFDRYAPKGASPKPVPFALRGNFPNPFNMATTIEFSLSTNSHTELLIYNIMGQKIRELLSENMEAGMHRALWDGRNESGDTVSAGMYVSRLTSGGRVMTHKMMVVK